MSVTPDFIRGLDELVRTDLQKLRDSYFFWLLISTGVVILGVLLEGPELVWEVRGVIREHGFPQSTEPLTPIPERRTPAWVILIALGGWLLVSLGVAGEGISEGYVSRADGLLQTFNNTLLSDTSDRASNAEITARAFQSQIAEATARAAMANQTAEAEKLARVRIEASVAWRRLTKQQQDEIGTSLANRFSNQRVSVWYMNGDTEGSSFAADIARALQAAHTLPVQPPASVQVFQSSGRFGDPVRRVETGVILQSTKDDYSRSLADAIIQELTARGFDAVRQSDPPFDPNPTPQVWVTVEPRPEGAQGEFKLAAQQAAKK